MAPWLAGLIHGALGGLNAAGGMTVLRMAARRAELIDKMVPQAMQEWAWYRSGLRPPGGRSGHHVADQLMHPGYGATVGAAYGALTRGRAAPTSAGVLLGVVTWALADFAILPGLGAARVG